MTINFIQLSIAIDTFKAAFNAAAGSSAEKILAEMQYHVDHLMPAEARENACDLIHDQDWDFDDTTDIFELFIPIYNDICQMQEETETEAEAEDYKGYKIEISENADQYAEFALEYHISQNDQIVHSGNATNAVNALSAAMDHIDTLTKGVM